MAGKMCPKCGEPTFFEKPFGRECSRCGHNMILPANGGKGGKGQRCTNCRQFTVFDGKCRNCGARYE